jgi:hypothetical protein
MVDDGRQSRLSPGFAYGSARVPDGVLAECHAEDRPRQPCDVCLAGLRRHAPIERRDQIAQTGQDAVMERGLCVLLPLALALLLFLIGRVVAFQPLLTCSS